MSSIWSEVQWDQGATDALVRQLLASAGAVGDVIAVLDGDGPIDPGAWGGPHRAAFDGQRQVLVKEARRVADALVDAARQAAALTAAAAGEDRLRARLRDRAAAEAACVAGRPC